MNQQRIEIKLSKLKTVISLLGAIAFVALSIWLLTVADEYHRRFSPEVIRIVSYAGIIFFGAAGCYIFYKLFDPKPGLIIDEEGIYDNSSAAATGQLIRWESIKGIRVEQVASTKFILIDIKDPEQYIEQSSGLKKKLMQGNYKMYGTPVSMASVALQIRFDDLVKLIGERLQK